MLNLSVEQLETLDAIAQTGSFEAAAFRLHVTPSAVSQRIRALETAIGQVIVHRGRPATLTPAGREVAKYASHLLLQQADLLASLGVATGESATENSSNRPRLPVVISADALATWALGALAEVARTVDMEVVREDEHFSLDKIRSGNAVAAISTVADPVPGCRVSFLGTMRYRAWADESFAGTWFAGGIGRAALGRAPMLNFDRQDQLQTRYLAERWQLRPEQLGVEGGAGDALTTIRPPMHFIPSTAEFAHAIGAGMGWGLIDDLQIAPLRNSGVPWVANLVEIDPGYHVDVPLYLQRQRLHSASLDVFVAAITRAAHGALGH